MRFSSLFMTIKTRSTASKRGKKSTTASVTAASSSRNKGSRQTGLHRDKGKNIDISEVETDDEELHSVKRPSSRRDIGKKDSDDITRITRRVKQTAIVDSDVSTSPSSPVQKHSKRASATTSPMPILDDESSQQIPVKG